VGVLKTLGFTNNAILGIIIGEAATIALIGGIVGVLLASVVTIVVGNFAANFNAQLNNLTVTPIVALICLGVALSIGVISSFIPAFNAARTNILDSLRYAG
jgi:putative ABC transport system permease protein